MQGPDLIPNLTYKAQSGASALLDIFYSLLPCMDAIDSYEHNPV